MGKITLTNGPTTEEMEAMKTVLAASSVEPALELKFLVAVDGQIVRHPRGGISRTPRLRVKLTKIAGTPILTRQHLPITLSVTEDFAGGELLYHGYDIGKAGTTLEVQYSFVDHAGSIEGFTPPGVGDHREGCSG